MKTQRIVPAILMVMVAACDGRTPVAPDPVELEWLGSVSGVEEWTGVTAEAAMRWTEGNEFFTAGIALAGDEPGAVRPWHVHLNTCAEGGAIFGLDEHYPRLEVGADGTAAVVVDVPMVPSPNVGYHVNVHLSEEEMDVVIACGDITLDEAGTLPPPTIPGY
jgi:superoxide dismutase, Cu-Zn family